MVTTLGSIFVVELCPIVDSECPYVFEDTTVEVFVSVAAEHLFILVGESALCVSVDKPSLIVVYEVEEYLSTKLPI